LNKYVRCEDYLTDKYERRIRENFLVIELICTAITDVQGQVLFSPGGTISEL
jgi:hypothetical protein